MELRLYLRILQRGWWLIVLTMLSALNIALLYSLLATPTYRARARFLVSPTAAFGGTKDELNSLVALDKRTTVSTYAEVLNSDRLYSEALAALGLPASELENYSISTVVLPETSILELLVVGADAQLTAAIANSLGQKAIAYISGLYQVYEISFLEPANAPTVAISPQPARDVSLAVMLGAALGVVLAVLREQIREPITAFRGRMATDPMSNAYTSRSFRAMLDEAVLQQDLIALGMIRLDGLSDLYDRLPQAVVRSVLREVTTVLDRELRGADLVGRWGETSFIIMLPNTPSEAAVATFGRILIALSRPIRISADGEMLRLEPAIGVAVRQYGEPAHILLQHTEGALQQADRDTRNLVLYTVDPFVAEAIIPRQIEPPQPRRVQATVITQPTAPRSTSASAASEPAASNERKSTFIRLTSDAGANGNSSPT